MPLLLNCLSLLCFFFFIYTVVDPFICVSTGLLKCYTEQSEKLDFNISPDDWEMDCVCFQSQPTSNTSCEQTARSVLNAFRQNESENNGCFHLQVRLWLFFILFF